MNMLYSTPAEAMNMHTPSVPMWQQASGVAITNPLAQSAHQTLRGLESLKSRQAKSMLQGAINLHRVGSYAIWRKVALRSGDDEFSPRTTALLCKEIPMFTKLEMTNLSLTGRQHTLLNPTI